MVKDDADTEGGMDVDLEEYQAGAEVIGTEEVSDEFAAFAAEILVDPKADIPVYEPMIKLVGPFEVRLNDVYDGEGRSVARCGYLHNTRASGPPIAEVVCAALNRYHGKR